MPTATRVRDHCLAPARAVDAPTGGGTYRRLFPELAPLDCDDGVLHELGRAGGACDTVDAAEDEGSSDADGAAGWPFLGQFVAHDITADRSPLTHHAEVAGIRNARSPRTATVPPAAPTCTTVTTRPSCCSAATTPAGPATSPVTRRASP